MIDLHDTETRLTDETSGGQKGTKVTQVGALDPVALIALARVAGIGAAKYEAFNYLKGYDWSLSFNAMQRHALLFWSGEDTDAETGQPHITMAGWHALALTSFMLRGVGNDDRPPTYGETEPEPVAEPVRAEMWGEGDGPVYGMSRAEWEMYGLDPKVTEAVDAVGSHSDGCSGGCDTTFDNPPCPANDVPTCRCYVCGLHEQRTKELWGETGTLCMCDVCTTHRREVAWKAEQARATTDRRYEQLFLRRGDGPRPCQCALCKSREFERRPSVDTGA
jgi:hypothetical protein